MKFKTGDILIGFHRRRVEIIQIDKVGTDAYYFSPWNPYARVYHALMAPISSIEDNYKIATTDDLRFVELMK